MKTETIEATEPKTRKWTRDEYYQMADLGWFVDQPVELIDGQVVEKASQTNLHAIAIELTGRMLRDVFGPGFWIRTRAPINLGPYSEPEPDLAVVPGTPRDFQDHPTAALLVVEVSDSTLAFDAGRKANLYASAGVADYWIVNLVNHRLEIRRSPVPDEGAPFGHRYTDLTSHQRGDSVTPLARPGARVAVADLLP